MKDTKVERPKDLNPKIYKCMLLIHAYMQSQKIEDPKLLADQEYILLLAPRIISYIIELTIENSMYCKLICKRAIKFSQLFFQVPSLTHRLGIRGRRLCLLAASLL